MSSPVTDTMFNTNLLTTVYRQYWPVPGWNGLVTDDHTDQNKHKTEMYRRRKGPAKKCPPRVQSEVHNENGLEDKRSEPLNGTSFSKLDKETLQRLGWTEKINTGCDQSSAPMKNNTDPFPSKLTKAEFRRLSDQVREVSMEFCRRYRPASSLQSSYHIDGKPVQYPPGKNSTHVYRSQLAASLRVFQLKTREPLDVEQYLKPPALPSRPTSSHPDTRKGSQKDACPRDAVKRSTRLLRPRSVPARAYRSLAGESSQDPEPGHFDTLNPELLSRLVVEKRPQSAYGDRVPSLGSFSSSDSPGDGTIPCDAEEFGDVSSTSGLESNVTYDSDISDGEADQGEEPRIDSHRHIPQMALRPEKWDAVYSPPERNDPRRFDFDAETTEIPEYEFANPLPDYFSNLDLQAASTSFANNPYCVMPKESNDIVNKFIKRLATMEKFQAETVEAEKKKREKQKQTVVRPKLQKSPSFCGSSKDKSCSSDCLQVACTGSCPCKKVPPDRCGHQGDLLSSTGYADVAYEMRMRHRQTPSDTKSTEYPSRPRSCNSCKRVHTAKYINANNVMLGRPRSGNSTYSSGQGSQKPKDMRTKDAGRLPNSVVKEFEKLGIKANKPSYSKSQVSLKGRSAMLPGKSFYSQRRTSLTKTYIKQRLNVMAGKRVTSQRIARRPLTAE